MATLTLSLSNEDVLKVVQLCNSIIAAIKVITPIAQEVRVIDNVEKSDSLAVVKSIPINNAVTTTITTATSAPNEFEEYKIAALSEMRQILTIINDCLKARHTTDSIATQIRDKQWKIFNLSSITYSKLFVQFYSQNRFDENYDHLLNNTLLFWERAFDIFNSTISKLPLYGNITKTELKKIFIESEFHVYKITYGSIPQIFNFIMYGCYAKTFCNVSKKRVARHTFINSVRKELSDNLATVIPIRDSVQAIKQQDDLDSSSIDDGWLALCGS